MLGDILIDKEKKYLYFHVGECKVIQAYDNTPVDSKMYSDMVLKYSLKNKKGLELLEKVLNNKATAKDMSHYFTISKTASENTLEYGVNALKMSHYWKNLVDYADTLTSDMNVLSHVTGYNMVLIGKDKKRLLALEFDI